MKRFKEEKSEKKKKVFLSLKEDEFYLHTNSDIIYVP